MPATAPAADFKLADPWMPGIDNLLINCAEVKSGANVLFINEPSFFIERDAVEAMEERARMLGATVTSLWTGRAGGPDSIAESIIKQIEAADITIFNHTMGAMLRLRPIAGGGIRVLNYATTRSLLESDYARVAHNLWAEASKMAIQEINRVRRWHITCDLGTEVEGVVPESESQGIKGMDAFAIRTFPIGTHRPTSSMQARGRLAVRWFTSASLHDFGSQGIKLEEPIMLEFADGKIRGFTGNQRLIDKTVDYLEEVGNKTHKEGMMINSWHAGINPQTYSPWNDDNDSLEAWMNVAHNSPHILHFHAIGESIPGELSVPIIDPTVTMDDKKMWQGGRFLPLERPEFVAVTKRYENGERAFVDNLAIGI
ncbi:MAG TPA: hypothetical protein VG986_20310 [Pseudolabrys sp.]|nr:hypothetical protein [Pseudolabrys sp.]